jgi:hypothetical protein
MGAGPSTVQGTPSLYPNESKIYIRWITLEAAMGHSHLTRIAVDRAFRRIPLWLDCIKLRYKDFVEASGGDHVLILRT